MIRLIVAFITKGLCAGFKSRSGIKFGEGGPFGSEDGVSE
jgi:hypothetical protein